jgi:hypothetical protein
MKKKIIGLIAVLVLSVGMMTGCASLDRAITDVKSEVGNGLNRTITVYTANGEIIAQYKGKIDIQESEGGYVKFDFNGKRYIYYNCFIETIADK